MVPRDADIDLSKLYSTGDVMTLTSLSRQTLHTYKRMGLIAPAYVTATGRAYYHESVFERIRRISLYKRHRPLQDVKAILEAQGMDDGSATEPTGADEIVDEDKHEEPTRGEHGEPIGMLHALPSPEELKAKADDTPVDPTGYPKLYRIGEVIRISGVRRQTLHNYTVQGLIQPRGRTKSGHRLYGPDVFARLKQIGLLKRHRHLDEVQRLLDRDEDAERDQSSA